jgi:hypothetical protein
MKKAVLLVLLAMSLPAAAADCIYPRAPGRMPDGNTASREEMVTAKKQVDDYIASMNGYLDCIKAEHDTAMADTAVPLNDEQKKQITVRFVQKNDAAVDEQQDVASRFNEQRHIFLDKTKKK